MSLGDDPLRLFPGDIAVVTEIVGEKRSRRYRIIESGFARMLIEPIEGTAEGKSALNRKNRGWEAEGAERNYRVNFEAGSMPPPSFIEGYVGVVTVLQEYEADLVTETEVYMSKQDAIEKVLGRYSEDLEKEYRKKAGLDNLDDDSGEDSDDEAVFANIYPTLDDYVQDYRDDLSQGESIPAPNLQSWEPKAVITIKEKKIWEPRVVTMIKPAGK